ncbi:MAG: glutamine-hydrolyzing GMP synthase, partial [Thermodesulfobacteriota bacterium]
MSETVLVLDFGSQYTQLIARRVRELGVFSEIKPFYTSIDEIRESSPGAVILSGGPSSVWDKDSPSIDEELFEMGIPILGICYGMQLIVQILGGKVEKSSEREFGPAYIKTADNEDLFFGMKNGIEVWMSHSDKVLDIPQGFSSIAKTENTPVASIKNHAKQIYGTQFHPEVVHTPLGKEILKNFLYRICNIKGTWSAESFVENAIREIRERVGDSNVICALSGGVDSTVTAVLLREAIGDKLTCVFVDTGLMRLNESREVVDRFNELGLNLIAVNAGDRFLKRLNKVVDPEEKRKIIGDEFINVFDEKAIQISDVKFLAQGTLYP